MEAERVLRGQKHCDWKWGHIHQPGDRREGGGAAVHSGGWELAVLWETYTLSEPTRCRNVRTQNTQVRRGGASYCPICPGLVSSSRPCPGASQGPTLSVTWTLAGRGHTPLCHLPPLSSPILWGASLWALPPAGGPGSSPPTESWFGALVWWPQAGPWAPAGMDPGLRYGFSSSSPRTVRLKHLVCSSEIQRKTGKEGGRD